MDILGIIKSRRSVRKYDKENIPINVIEKIIEAGSFAPSGLNNQPWKFKILQNEEKNQIAKFTKYGNIILKADKVIIVFLDKENSYNFEKDLMAIGACIQNMLLYIHSINLGACWLGEILNKKDEIMNHFKISNLYLAAVIAIGKPLKENYEPERKKISELLLP